MWNHIRGPPFAHRNPQTGEVVITLLFVFRVERPVHTDTVMAGKFDRELNLADWRIWRASPKTVLFELNRAHGKNGLDTSPTSTVTSVCQEVDNGDSACSVQKQ